MIIIIYAAAFITATTQNRALQSILLKASALCIHTPHTSPFERHQTIPLTQLKVSTNQI